MRQEWITVIGLVLDVIGVALVFAEWLLGARPDIYSRELPGDPLKAMNLLLRLQRYWQSRHSFIRLWLMLGGFGLIVIGFVVQILGALPAHVLPAGIVPQGVI